MKTIEKNIGKINVRYDLDMESGREILDNSTGPWDLIYNGFAIGYIQGMKAAKAEIKKGVK